MNRIYTNSAVIEIPHIVQDTGDKYIGNPATSGYLDETNQTRFGLFDPKIHPNDQMTYPMLETMPQDSTAIGETVLTADSFKIGEDPEMEKIDYGIFQQQLAKADIHGYRTGLERHDPSRFGDPVQSVPDLTPIDVDRYHKVMASSEYGYNAIDRTVLRKVSGNKKIMGYNQYGRAYGLERAANRAIIESPADGLEYTTPTAVPSNDNIKINQSGIKPVLVAAPNV